MLEKDATIGNIKHEVLFKVAKLAYAGELAEKQDRIAYELIPGQKANFRCCVYKEREIIRQRVLVAQGKAPSPKQKAENIIQIIPAACEGCPITRFVVTDNCQKCMMKKCQQACHFKAITMLRDRAYIDPNNCKECGKCSEACPYNAIADLMRPCRRSCLVDAISRDENNVVVIDEEKCIQCGNCIKNCPFGAIEDRSSMTQVIDEIRKGKKVYAMVAPAGEGQFGSHVSMGVLAEAVKELGFTDMVEVALGADYVAKSEAEEWAEGYKEGKKMTTSCCPAFVKMIHKHFPQLVDNISTTISPMAATARLLREKDPDCLTVFVGPCIAKKGEIQDNKDTADYVLTFDELYAMLRAKEVQLATFGTNLQQGSIYGKRFANAGGVTKAVMEAFKEAEEEIDVKVKQCSGAAECKKALMLLKVNRLPEDFVEGMACIGGCVNGPGNVKPELLVKKDRETLLSHADDRTIEQSIEPYKDYKFSMHRE